MQRLINAAGCYYNLINFAFISFLMECFEIKKGKKCYINTAGIWKDITDREWCQGHVTDPGKKGQGGLGMLIRRFRQAMKPTTHWLLGHQQQQTGHKSRQVGHCRLLYPVLAVAEILLWSDLWISVLKKIKFLVNVVITDLRSKTSRHPLTFFLTNLQHSFHKCFWYSFSQLNLFNST